MALASNNQGLLNDLKHNFSNRFDVKLLGSLQSFIGWEIRRSSNGIQLSQGNYLRRLLREHNLSHVKPAPTPIPLSADFSSLSETDTPLSPVDHARYRSLVGALMYAAVCTRPDLSFPVSILARQMHAPAQRHLLLTKRVVRYVAGTLDKSIHYLTDNSASEPLTAYTDSDWAGCYDTRRSTSDMVITVNGSPVLWSSKRQSMVSLSSAEAEYIAISQCAKQVTWLRRLFVEMVTHSPYKVDDILDPTPMFTDSTAALSLAKNPQVSERNKHIEIKVHHVRDLVQKKKVELQYVPSEENPADILTKPVSRGRLDSMTRLLRM